MKLVLLLLLLLLLVLLVMLMLHQISPIEGHLLLCFLFRSSYVTLELFKQFNCAFRFFRKDSDDDSNPPDKIHACGSMDLSRCVQGYNYWKKTWL